MANGIEKIKTLASKEKNLSIKKVADYLVTRSDMDEKYLNENKDLEKMWSYITERAKKQAVNGVACINDEEIYNWAIHYWDESEEDLKNEKETNDKLSKKETKAIEKESSNEIDAEKDVSGQKTEQKNGQKDTDIVFKYKGKDVTRAQFESKEFLTW